MKILHIGQMIGGLDVYIRNTIMYSECVNEYIIVHGKDDNNSPVEKDGKVVKEYKTSLCRELNIWKDAKSVIQALKIVLQEQPDLIHCHSAKGGCVGRVVGFITRVPTFYTPHAFSFLCTQSRLKRTLYLFIERMTRLNAHLLACSESELMLGKDFVHYKDDMAHVWSNAIPDLSPNIKQEEVKQNNYFCFIGRPSYQKNPYFFVNVAKDVHERHPDISILLLGVGYHSPDIENMKAMISKYGLDTVVKIIPWLNHTEVLKYIKNTLFYLTVARYEGLPLAVLEAMSFGKCIIASDVLGNKDCVKDMYNGRLLPLEKTIFVETICNLIENKELMHRYGNNSRKLFEERFLITKRIKELDVIYKSLLRITKRY
ncbi:MAG: glycosyltransferase [Prevotellaceae bacterium]|nr:glycosyltransferase [Prevotellaceae bacterium]